MTERKDKEEKKKNAIVISGTAAILALVSGIIFSAINERRNRKKKKRDVPGLHIRANLSASDISKIADRVVSRSKDIYDSVAAVPLDKVTYVNTISPLAELEIEQFPLIQTCVLHKMVSSSEEVRKAAVNAERRIDTHISMCSKRDDVYRCVKVFSMRNEWLGSEAKHYILSWVKEFERNGVNLAPCKRQELDHLRTQLDELSFRYIQSINEDSGFLLFSESELAGMPTNFIQMLDRTEVGKLKISLRSHHTLPILEHCKIGSTRKAVAVARGQRCGNHNTQLLEKMVQLRHKLARLLGYPNFADFSLESRMPGTSAKVVEFLENVSTNLNDLAVQELAVLKRLKKIEEGESSFGMEDLLYYMRKARDRDTKINYANTKKYFPVGLVVSGVLKIFQELFGLLFEQIQGADVWHADVQLFSVTDVTSHELLGYFYLDLYARHGKYNHMCVLPLQNGCLHSNGSRQIPVAALIAQLPKETDGVLSVLCFSQVTTLFHEFGHVVHHLCNRASYARFSGLHSDADFVEISSYMLENWCYESIPLKIITGHYDDITKSITDETCRALKRNRHSFSALKIKQEIFYCLLDQIIHTGENLDMVELLRHLHPKVMLGIPLLEGINLASCYPRLVVGYECTCYSQIWSEALSADLFVSKFQNSLLDQIVGVQFRNKVYLPGGFKDPIDILTDFLGREPSIQAFVERKKSNSPSAQVFA